MAFLDNSGDIILDAVLTDLGRLRMSEGNFRITQFALGDDEVDYSLYNKNHPSGSAYYDLEILQTPVFEAFTRTNASINYGLASYNGNQNLLYLPTIKLNTKAIGAKKNAHYYPSSTGVVYYSVGNTGADASIEAGLGSSVVFIGKNNSNVLLFETGLDSQGSDALAGNDDKRRSFIVNNSLVDLQFTVLADERVFGGIRTPTGFIDWPDGPIDSAKAGDAGDVSLSTTVTTLSTATQQIENYGFATLNAQDNKLYESSVYTDTDVSVINGPRAAVGAFSLSLSSALFGGNAAAEYARLGKENQDLFSDGNLYDYIDTLVYIRGDVTGVTLQVPIRVIRKV